MSQAEEIVRWYSQGTSERSNFDTTCDEIQRFMDPHGPNILTTGVAGEKRTLQIFDNVAGWGGNVLANFIQGAACSPAFTWFSLSHPDVDTNRDTEVAAWNTNTRDQTLSIMRNSFYAPIGQAIHSWIFYGNGVLLTEEVPKKREGLNLIRYTAPPYGSYVMFEGDDGVIDKFIRCLMLPAHIAVTLGDVSDDIRKCAEKEPLKKFEILHSIMPRDLQSYSKNKVQTIKQMPWSSCWIEKDKKRLIKESGYRKFPVAVARYNLIAGETYGRGPAELALPDARSLNQADQKALLKWDRELDPPTLTKTGSVINGVLDKRAGGNTMVRDVQAIRPLFEGSNWQAHDTMAQRKTEAVLRMFHVSEIQNLTARDKPEMTAFEWNGHLQLLRQMLGPVFDRFEDDMLSKAVELTIDILAANGLLEPMPEMMGNEGLYNVVYEGPLAKAKRQEQIMDIQQSVADLAGVQPLFPEAVLMLDGPQTIRNLFEIRGTQHLLKSQADFNKASEQAAAQQNAEKMLGVVAGGAEALGKAAPGIKVLKDENAQAA